jgi:hypothetical protein
MISALLAQSSRIAGTDLQWTNSTQLHPFALAAVVIGGWALVMLPRRNALLPIILIACFIAPAQRLVVGSLDFNILRLMVLFGWCRLWIRHEHRGFTWMPLDWINLITAVVGTMAYTVQQASVGALINRLGYYYDAVGMYFLFRCLIRDWDDIRQAAHWFALVSIPVLGFFLVERATGRNLFSVLGGVPSITLIRGSRMRCQGAFAHPILAGCFWASVLPLILGLWFHGGRWRREAILGSMCACGIIVLCASSTPVSALLFGIVGGLAFFVRRHLRVILLCIVVLAVFVHFSMNKPIWHLIARIDVAGGSTGWHRYHLIDAAINRANEWWLVGIRNTGHWGYGLQDVTNQYILDGVRGGIWCVLLLLMAIFVGFRHVGQLVKRAANKQQLYTAWAVGVCLFIHILCFVSVSYFGQITILWYMCLAMIGSLGVMSRPAPVRSRAIAARPLSLQVAAH